VPIEGLILPRIGCSWGRPELRDALAETSFDYDKVFHFSVRISSNDIWFHAGTIRSTLALETMAPVCEVRITWITEPLKSLSKSWRLRTVKDNHAEITEILITGSYARIVID
jgi:hypothetical protein